MHYGGVYRALHGIQILCRIMVFADAIHFTTVGNIYCNHRKGLDIFKNQQKPGRPHIFSSKDAHFAALCLAHNTAQSAADIHHCYYPGVSTSTIHRHLHELDLSPYKCCQKPYLSHKHKSHRLDWAQQHRSWSLTQWHQVAFADEKKFNVYAPDPNNHCWRKQGEAVLAEWNGKKVVKHGGGSVSVYGVITPEGVGWLHHIQGTLDSIQYTQILEESLLGTLEDLHISLCDIIYQQDQDPKHTAQRTTKWLEEHSIQVLPWPLSSLDMNIIENVWAYLDCWVHTGDKPPQNSKELWHALQEEWYQLSPSYITNLYRSLCQSPMRRKYKSET
jgi:hypothetical protein